MTGDDQISTFFETALRRKIDPDLDVFELGLVDSLFAIQLVAFVEEQFSITVERTELDIDNFRSVNALTEFVQGKKNRSAADTPSTC